MNVSGRPCSEATATFRCDSDDQCIWEEKICDLTEDCDDGSDERNCNHTGML